MSRYEDLKDRARETIFDNVMGEIEAPKHQKMIHDILDRLEIDVDDLYNTSDSHTEDISQLKSDVEIKLDAEQYNSDKELQKEIDENQDKRIDDNRVKISESNQEIKVIKDTLKHLNSSDEIQEAKGGSVINLPNNAMKSVVPNYRFEGLTLTNLVQNGDFNDGTRNWNVSGIEIIKVEKGVITFKKKTSPLIQIVFKTIDEDIFYSSAYVKSNSNTTRLSINTGNIVYHSGNGDFERLSLLERAPKERGVNFSLNTDDLNDEITMQGGVCIYNLTQMFGAGNEPSKEWCDEHIQGYVEGTKSVQLPMRVKSVGENLFNAFVPKRMYEGDFGEELDHNLIKRWNNTLSNDRYGYKILLLKGESYFISYNCEFVGDFDAGYGHIRDWSSNKIVESHSSREKNKLFTVPKTGYYYITFGGTKPNQDKSLGNPNNDFVIFKNILVSKLATDFKPYQESLAYLNDEVELRSVTNTKDYIENGKLYKNISDDGEILEKTEVVNLSTSGLITANPNGTIFLEPITNITGFYDNGLDVEGLDILEVEEFSHLINGVYQNLDVSKVKIEGGKLTHPDAQNGLVYLVYRYDDNPVYGESAISYYNNNRVLESPNGTFFKPVFSVDDEGNITMKGEKL